MKNYSKFYSNEERREYAIEAIQLMEEYRKYQQEDNVIEMIHTRERLGRVFLILSYSVLSLVKVTHTSGQKFKIGDFGVEEHVQDAAITILGKLEENEIDMTGYDKYPEKFISYCIRK